MRYRGFVSGLVALLTLLNALAWGAEPPHPVGLKPTAPPVPFPRSPRLARRIDFWKEVFTLHRADDVVIHDSKYVHIIYNVLHLEGASPAKMRAATAAEKRRVRTLLLRMDKRADRPEKLRATERAIYALFQDVSEPHKFRAAAERVRAQSGLREQFREGIRVSRRYLPEMERIFRGEGLPVELTRLPLIESCFNVKAYSWRGAAGVWQFMPRTGRLHGLRVDRLVDERRDPLRAGRAAARYLVAAHAQLGSWPLAITAYNHGVKGIRRGVQALRSNAMEDLIERYEGRGFGFAGQNFYAEFLAALDIDRNPERYFGQLAYEPPLVAEEIVLRRAMRMHDAARAAGVSKEVLAAYNPALGRGVLRGGARVPRGARLWIPAGTTTAFEEQMTAVGVPGRSPIIADVPGTHRVRRGETLSHVARRYGTTVAALEEHNGIGDARQLRAGQVLRIPEQTGVGQALLASAPVGRHGGVRHRVRRGQTLTHIAHQYGTTVRALKEHNGIRNAKHLRAGQLLRIPGQGREPQVDVPSETTSEGATLRYRVRPGETLIHIARRYGTTTAALVRHNAIRDPRRLRAGQILEVPDARRAGRLTVATARGSRQGRTVAHRVRPGQTLSHIAREYGTSVRVLKQHNGIRAPRRIRAGQVLEIPVQRGVARDAKRGGDLRHRVSRGETLSHIAHMYDTDVKTLMKHNEIRDARQLRAHQVIEIPAS